MKWNRAEEELILQEERMGVRLKLLSPRWREVSESFAAAVEGPDATEQGRESQGEDAGLGNG